MLKRVSWLYFVVLGLSGLGVAGCSGTATGEDSVAGSDEAELIDQTEEALQGPGQTCGGIGALQCGAGLQCVDKPGDGCTFGQTPDCAGVCQQVCGGFAGVQCPASQVCVDIPGDGCTFGQTPDCTGVCSTPTLCAGLLNLQCPAGQVCVDDPRDTCQLGQPECGGICAPGPSCAAAYSQANCFVYSVGTTVSRSGHNYTCSNGNCRNCAGFASCAPGASGCPWGNVWTDNGVCQ